MCLPHGLSPVPLSLTSLWNDVGNNLSSSSLREVWAAEGGEEERGEDGVEEGMRDEGGRRLADARILMNLGLTVGGDGSDEEDASDGSDGSDGSDEEDGEEEEEERYNEMEIEIEIDGGCQNQSESDGHQSDNYRSYEEEVAKMANRDIDRGGWEEEEEEEEKFGKFRRKVSLDRGKVDL